MTLLCCLLQYNRFIQLMERLLSMPCCATEEEFILRYRRQLEAQSRKQMVPPLQRDDRGVAFSTSDGRYAHLTCFSTLQPKSDLCLVRFISLNSHPIFPLILVSHLALIGAGCA